MISQIITTFGLVLDVVGAGLLFFYAFPQPSFEQGTSLGLEDETVLSDGKTVSQHNREIQRQKQQYVNISKSAFASLICGAIFQLVGVWIK